MNLLFDRLEIKDKFGNVIFTMTEDEYTLIEGFEINFTKEVGEVVN